MNEMLSAAGAAAISAPFSVQPPQAPEAADENFSLQGRLRFIHRCTGLVLALGCLVLLGWLFDLTALKSVLPHQITMKANTAIALMLLATALLALYPAKVHVLRRAFGYLCTGAAMAIAVATLAEYFANVNLGLDEWLFIDRDGRSGAFPPGRLAPVTAVNILLLGTAFFGSFNRAPRPWYRLAQIAAFITCLSSFQALVGYLCGVTNLFGSAFYTAMAIHTAAGFALLSLSFLTATADKGFMPVFFAQSLGGSTLRRLLGAVLIVPPLIAWLESRGQHTGLFDADFGMLFRVLGNIILFTILIWKTSVWLHQLDGKRRQAESFILQANELLQSSLRREQQARAEFEGLYAAASRLNRVKDEFLATLSHELRTPLTIISGWVDVLGEECGTDQQIKATAVITRHTAALGAIIDDLLDMSTLLTGRQQIDKAPLPLGEVVAKALASVELAASTKNIQLKTDLAAATVLGSADRLHQVLWHVLTNAIKYTPNGGEVAVTLRIHADAAELTIADTGCGIDPAFLPYVFERFRQEDSSSSRSFGGLGLGLAISRYLIEMHGGTIAAASEGKGRGATFTITLPHQAAAAAAAADQAPIRAAASPAAAIPAPANKTPLSGVRVLVVDDAPDTLQFLRVLLKRYGALVETADSAAAALAILSLRRPDVLISDIGMPLQDGYELIRQIREQERVDKEYLPAAALTAYVQDVERRRALEAGFQAHLAKPVKAETLVATIISLITKPRSAFRLEPLSDKA